MQLWDDHQSKGSQSQPIESYYAILKNAGNAVIVETSPLSNLPDYSWIAPK
jgi:hypothetical protein